MNLRKQLELLQLIAREAREHRSRAVLFERLARKLARAWDALEESKRKAPLLPFPKRDAQPEAPQSPREPQA
jgi:hypothetical protein